MDLGPPPARRPVCAMLICLLGAARCSGDGGMCPCPEIPGRNDTLPPARSCFQVSDKFRYICKEPNLRKAGTSGLTKCKQESKAPPDWSPINLQCIADPNRTTRPPAGGTAPADLNTTSTRPPESPVTTAAAPSGPQRSSSEPTSPGLQAPWGHSQAGQDDAVRETEATPPVAASSTAARAGIGFASVATVGALIGLGFFCYKRRSQSAVPQETPEEEFPMNSVPSEL